MDVDAEDIRLLPIVRSHDHRLTSTPYDECYTATLTVYIL